MLREIGFVLLLLPTLAAPAQEDVPYHRTINHVFAMSHGTGLVMDVFVPKADANGLGIIDVLSGAWYSARGQLNDHMRAKIFDIYTGRGYTVFMIRPGSRSKYSAEEMVENLKTGIRYVKMHAENYSVDSERLGITGASAGGHLTMLTLAMAEDGSPDAKNPLERFDTRVKAAAVFFPPTDFLDWGGSKTDLSRIGDLLFADRSQTRSEVEIEEQAKRISPARQVKEAFPPTLLIHGDADPAVPLQQSEKMRDVLSDAGGTVDLIVKPGGGHPWPTIPEEVSVCADWFDKHLRGGN